MVIKCTPSSDFQEIISQIGHDQKTSSKLLSGRGLWSHPVKITKSDSSHFFWAISAVVVNHRAWKKRNLSRTKWNVKSVSALCNILICAYTISPRNRKGTDQRPPITRHFWLPGWMTFPCSHHVNMINELEGRKNTRWPNPHSSF